MLSLQICWYGDLNDMTKGWVGREMDRTLSQLARVGSLLLSAVWPQLATPSTEHGAPMAHSPALASPFLKGLFAWAGAVGQSSGPMA